MLKKNLKRISLLITLFCMIFISSNKVSAKLLTVDEIIDELKVSTLVKYYEQSNYPLTIEKDENNSKIKVYNTSIGATIDINYTNDYLSFENSVSPVTYEAGSKAFFEEYCTHIGNFSMEKWLHLGYSENEGRVYDNWAFALGF